MLLEGSGNPGPYIVTRAFPEVSRQVRSSDEAESGKTEPLDPPAVRDRQIPGTLDRPGRHPRRNSAVGEPGREGCPAGCPSKTESCDEGDERPRSGQDQQAHGEDGERRPRRLADSLSVLRLAATPRRNERDRDQARRGETAHDEPRPIDGVR